MAHRRGGPARRRRRLRIVNAPGRTLRSRGTTPPDDPRTSGGVAAEIGIVLDPGRYVRNQAKVLESPQVAARASELLGGDPNPSEIHGSTSATAARDLDALTISAAQSTGAGAAAVVDAVVAYEEIVEEGISAKVETSIATLEQSKVDLQVRIAEIDAELVGDPNKDPVPSTRSGEAQRDSADSGRNRRISQRATTTHRVPTTLKP